MSDDQDISSVSPPLLSPYKAEVDLNLTQEASSAKGNVKKSSRMSQSMNRELGDGHDSLGRHFGQFHVCSFVLHMESTK